MGSVWPRLGAEVNGVIEYLDRIIAGMDGEVAQGIPENFEKQGMTFRLATKVDRAETLKETKVETLTSSLRRRRCGRRNSELR